MRLRLSLQYAAPRAGVPARATIARWARAALRDLGPRSVSLGVRIVGGREGAALNRRYRGRRGATNVLSFPFAPPAGTRSDALGDVVICAPVVHREAARAAVPARARWAHMVVHGILHLRGFDHRRPPEAARMEAEEARILAALHFPDPYA